MILQVMKGHMHVCKYLAGINIVYVAGGGVHEGHVPPSPQNSWKLGQCMPFSRGIGSKKKWGGVLTSYFNWFNTFFPRKCLDFRSSEVHSETPKQCCYIKYWSKLYKSRGALPPPPYLKVGKLSPLLLPTVLPYRAMYQYFIIDFLHMHKYLVPPSPCNSHCLL